MIKTPKKVHLSKHPLTKHPLAKFNKGIPSCNQLHGWKALHFEGTSQLYPTSRDHHPGAPTVPGTAPASFVDLSGPGGERHDQIPIVGRALFHPYGGGLPFLYHKTIQNPIPHDSPPLLYPRWCHLCKSTFDPSHVCDGRKGCSLRVSLNSSIANARATLELGAVHIVHMMDAHAAVFFTGVWIQLGSHVVSRSIKDHCFVAGFLVQLP